jgi:hypothetical protein
MKRSSRWTIILPALAVAALTVVLSRAHDTAPLGDPASIAEPRVDPDGISIRGLDLQQATFANALEQIGTQSHLNMMVCWRDLGMLGVAPSTPLHIQKTGPLSAGAALRLAIDDASPADKSIAWWIDGDVVVVGSADREAVVIRYYNIQPFLTPSGAQAHFTRQEVADSIIKLIEETVAPDAWRDAGGTVGSIHESGGVLVIGTTEEDQRQIELLLGQLLGLWRPFSPGEPIPPKGMNLFGGP